MEELTARPHVARAFWWATLVDEAVLRAWVVNIGRRDAAEAIGHLMCELYLRMKVVGLTTDHSYELPLTQEELADALGLTPVHVNRVLQRMRADGLISLKGGALTWYARGFVTDSKYEISTTSPSIDATCPTPSSLSSETKS